MTITEIKRKGKSELYYVYADEELFGLLQAEFIYKNKLKSGLEIGRKELERIKNQSDKLTCVNQALGYLSKMIRSEFQVRQYLKKHMYDDETIDEAICKLKSYGYINDEQVATLMVQSLSTKKGKNYIKKELSQKGIDKSQIALLTENLEGQEELCEVLAKKWLKNKVLPLNQNEKAKLYRFLAGKGFEFDVIKRATSKIKLGYDDDWD